jgi:hypothetical protein
MRIEILSEAADPQGLKASLPNHFGRWPAIVSAVLALFLSSRKQSEVVS